MLIFGQVVDKIPFLAGGGEGGDFIASFTGLLSGVTAIRPTLSHSLTPRFKLILTSKLSLGLSSTGFSEEQTTFFYNAFFCSFPAIM